MNKVVLIGRLTKDIELKYTPNINEVKGAGNRKFGRVVKGEKDESKRSI